MIFNDNFFIINDDDNDNNIKNKTTIGIDYINTIYNNNGNFICVF